MDRQVLLCGGPADGRWTVVPDHQVIVEVLKSAEIWWTPDPDVPDITKVRYWIDSCMILGHTLWVGVPDDEPVGWPVVMRTVLQRDVARHLGAYRP